MGQLRGGTCKRNITPPVGAWMAGYGGRDHGAEGVHDELFARVIVLDDGETQLAIVIRDLCFSENNELAMLAERVQERAGIGREHLFVADTHTHSGPDTHYGEDAKNRVYLENLTDVVAGAIVEAQGQMRDATVAHAVRPVQCGINRREKTEDGRTILGCNPDGPCDTVANVLCFADAESGEALATLFRHGVHGVVMGGDSYLISGDCPGAAEAFVERNVDGVAAFMAGCSGDINAHPRLSFEAVEMLGQRLGGAVCQGMTECDEPRRDVKLAGLVREVALPVEAVPPAAESEAIIAVLEPKLRAIEDGTDTEGLSRWHTERELEHARERLAAAQSGEPIAGKPIGVHVLAIGDIALIGYPNEVFFETGQAVQEQSPFAITLPVTHVGGWAGYVPTAAAYPDGGYEVDVARASHMGLRIVPEAETVLRDESLKALEQAKALVG